MRGYVRKESNDKLKLRESDCKKKKKRANEPIYKPVCVGSLCVAERKSVPGFQGRYSCRMLSAVSFSLGNCTSPLNANLVSRLLD